MTLKEVIAVLDSSVNFEVYESHRYETILHDSAARLSCEGDRKNWLERLDTIENRSVEQISRSCTDDGTLEIYIK